MATQKKNGNLNIKQALPFFLLDEGKAAMAIDF